MAFDTFEDLKSRIQEYYHSGDYHAALALATEEMDRFPEQIQLIYYWRITMAARLENEELAIRLLREALENGIWYGETLLRKSPSLNSLQGKPEFEQLLHQNRHMAEQDPDLNFPMLVLRSQGQCQAGGPSCPLLMGLHANASTARASVDFWRSAASSGWLVAMPQSSQAMWKGAYVWEDRQVAEHEIKKLFSTLTEQYHVDPQQIVLAGHSMGGEIAIWLALTGAIDVCGFIAIAPVGPWMDNLSNWAPLVRENLNVRLRGYLIIGVEDQIVSVENIEALAEMLNAAGIPCELEFVPLAGHEDAFEFESSLLRALEYVSES